MNELITLGVIATFMAIAYLVVYPKAKTVNRLRLLDLIFSVLAIGTVGLLFGFQNPPAQLLGVNWFLFALAAYVVLETPLWYLYMKSHPHQGTLAQLYGFAASSKATGQSIEKVMNDTKWDSIRTANMQKLLVILGVFSLVGAPLLFWFEDFVLPGIGILGVIPIFLIWWLLRISVRLVADAPDEYLDEFQVKQRDRTYLQSFRILAGVVSALAVALMAFIISLDYQAVDGVDYYNLALTFGQVNALIWAVLGSVILIPNLVLAWNQARQYRS